MHNARALRAYSGPVRHPTSAVDLQREVALLGLLRISPVESWQASTPALRRLLVRARVASVRRALSEEAQVPPPACPLWPPEVVTLAAGARDALLEAILAPLAGHSPTLRPGARRRLRLATALMAIPIAERAAWRAVERLGRRAPPELRHAWAIGVCALIRADAEGWRRAAERLLPALILAEIDPEAPHDWRALQDLHVRTRRQPAVAQRIGCLLACCEALRVRRLRASTGAACLPLPTPRTAPASDATALPG